MQVPRVHVDRAVTVEHGELPRFGKRSEHRLGELVVPGHADIDEAAGALHGAGCPGADDALEVVALQGELLRHIVEGVPAQQVDACADMKSPSAATRHPCVKPRFEMATSLL